jgi:hypothetical protein
MVEFDMNTLEKAAVGSLEKPPVPIPTTTTTTTTTTPSSSTLGTSRRDTTSTVWSTPHLKAGPIKQEDDWDDVMDLLFFRQFVELSLPDVVMSAVADIVIQPDNVVDE